MERPQVADMGDGIHIWGVVADNRQEFVLILALWAIHDVTKVTQDLGLGRIIWFRIGGRGKGSYGSIKGGIFL
jgi:hypothetical protein